MSAVDADDPGEVLVAAAAVEVPGRVGGASPPPSEWPPRITVRWPPARALTITAVQVLHGHLQAPLVHEGEVGGPEGAGSAA